MLKTPFEKEVTDLGYFQARREGRHRVQIVELDLFVTPQRLLAIPAEGELAFADLQVPGLFGRAEERLGNFMANPPVTEEKTQAD